MLNPMRMQPGDLLCQAWLSSECSWPCAQKCPRGQCHPDPLSPGRQLQPMTWSWVQQDPCGSLWGHGHAVRLPGACFLLFEGCAWGGCSLQDAGFRAVPSNVSAVPLHPLANLGRCSHSLAHPGCSGEDGGLCSPKPLGAGRREGSVLSCLSPPPRYRSRCSHSSSSRSSCGSYGRSRDRSSSSSSSSSYSSRSPSRRQSRSRSPSPRRRSNRRRR